MQQGIKMEKLSSLVKRYVVFSDNQGMLFDANCQPMEVPQQPLGIFDQCLWLIPPQRCLFKRLQYDAEYVAASEIEECVRSDSQQWTIWVQTEMCIQKQKIANQWQVSVWIWNAEHEQTLLAKLPYLPTHILPWSAYLSGRTDANSFALQTLFEQHWLTVTDPQGMVSGVYQATTVPQQQQLNRRFERQLADEISVYKYHYQGPWLTQLPHHEVTATLKYATLGLGKQKGITDFSDIKTYLKPLMVISLIGLCWGVGDYALIQRTQQNIDNEINSLSTKSQQAMGLRKQYQFDLSVIRVREQYLQREQLIGRTLRVLTETIPTNIYLTSVDVSFPHITISGEGKNVARLPVLLEGWNEVESARFTSDIKQAKNEMESFKVQLDLKEKR